MASGTGRSRTAEQAAARSSRGNAVGAENLAPSVLGRGDLPTSLSLVVPLLLAYQIAVVYASSQNGVDFLTGSILAAVDHDRATYLLVQFSLAACFVIALAFAHRLRAASCAACLPVVLESAIYALTLGSFIVLIMEELLGFRLSGGGELALGPAGEAAVIALGAGVHEELIFRLGIMAGVAVGLRWLGMYHRPAVVAAVAVSALSFSLAHHIGPHGEAFAFDVFTYRALAGTAFGLVFYYRSLAHAVYTHFLYDLYVLLLRA